MFEPIILLQAMMLARKDINAQCPLDEHSQFTVGQTIDKLVKELSIEAPKDLFSDEDCFKCFGAALAAQKKERMVIGWHYSFSVASRVIGPDGNDLVWSVEDRDNAQDMLERAMDYIEMDFRQVAIVRNPVDIYYSLVERYLVDDLDMVRLFKERVRREIGDYFSNIIKKLCAMSLPLVSYEQICSSPDQELETLLAKMHFLPDDIARLDKSLIHKGALEKWRLYPPSKVKILASSFQQYMEPLGYTVHPRNRFIHAFISKFYALRKYHSEIKIINRLASGDYTVNWAFSHHNRSIPARIWFRILIFFPGPRKNVETYYRTHKDTPRIPTRSLLVIFRDLLSGSFH